SREGRIRAAKAEPRASQVTRLGEKIGVQRALVRSVDAIEGLIHASASPPALEAHLISHAFPQHRGYAWDALVDQVHLVTTVSRRFATRNAAPRAGIGELGGDDDASAEADHRTADEPPDPERASDGAHLAPTISVGQYRLERSHLETRHVA